MANPNKLRHKARCFAAQALYQAQFAEHGGDVLVKHAVEGIDLNSLDFAYLTELVNGVVENVEKIDATLGPLLDRGITELNPVELAVLRLACYELLFRLDIPYRVIINEAVELAKKYGSEQGYKYINGVLDAAGTQLRVTEKNK